MQSFKDTEGRDWAIAVNVAAISRCRKLLGIDLYALLDHGFGGLGKLLGDPVDLANVLFVLCQSKAEERKITDEQFGAALAGDVLEKARDAFVEALIDFFPSAAGRAALRKVTGKVNQVAALMYAEATEKLDAITPAALLAVLKKPSGASPAASESTPDPSPSAN